MTVLNFKNYKVVAMKYQLNDNFFNKEQDRRSFNYSPNLKINFTTEEENKALVRIGFDSENELPFDINVIIEGEFEYNSEDDETKIGFEELLKKNATAILFPYLRAIVTQLTSMGNVYPPLILPTINVSALLDEENNKG